MAIQLSTHCEPCYNGHNQTNNATKYCTLCEESLCQNCALVHNSQKATRGHVLEDIKEDIEEVSEKTVAVCEPCFENGVSNTPTFKCVECDELYCDHCGRIHRSQKATRGHILTKFVLEDIRNVCEACSFIKIDRPAASRCVDCDEVLCDECSKAHKSQKATRSHEIQEHKNANKQTNAQQKRPGTSTGTGTGGCDLCKNHTVVAIAYCFTCRYALCKECAEEHGKSVDTEKHRVIQSVEPASGLDEVSVDGQSNILEESSQEVINPENQTDVNNSPSDLNDVVPSCIFDAQDRPDSSESVSDVKERKDVGEINDLQNDNCEQNDGSSMSAFSADCNIQPCSDLSEDNMQSEDPNLHRLLLEKKSDGDSSTQEKPQPDSNDGSIASETKDFCKPCKDKGTVSAVSAFCFDCLHTLCESCVKKHTESEEFKTHNVFNRSDPRKDPEKGTDSDRTESTSKEEIERELIKRTKPGKPVQVGALKVDSITITWSAPEDLFETCCYEVRYKEVTNNSKWHYYEIKTPHTSVTVKNLKSHCTYLLQVRMVNNETEGPYSEISDPIETLPSASELVLNLTDEIYELGSELKLRQFRLNENTAARSPQLKTRKLILGGDKRGNQKEKTILLLGASGTGKTTFVNGLVNYIFGITFADKIRFSIVDTKEDEGDLGSTGTKTLPKTSWITCYTVYPVKGSKTDYTLTIIDTPGFGEKGIDRDTEIKQQLKELFSAVDEKGVLFVDAVCIFLRASDSRLTVTQEYIYTTITSLFHRDIEENICSVITFSDGKPPPVLSALKDANLPYETYFPFNTTEIFADNQQPLQTSLTKVFFELNVSSFESFLKKLGTLKTKSLSLSTEVLQKRQQIEQTAEILLSKVESGLNKMEDCKTEIAILEKFKAQMKDNKDFKYKRKKHVQNLIPLEKGLHTTNCLHCNFTCHDNCAFANDEDKAQCVAMDGNGYCKVCEDHCFWKEHKNTPFVIQWLEVEEEGTYEEMMQKYQKASDEVVTHEAIVNKMKADLDAVENEMLGLMRKIADCSNQLSQMALRANPLSVAEHIDIIIENEKWERKPGFQKRINNLENLKRRIAVGEEFEHFHKSKEDICNK